MSNKNSRWADDSEALLAELSNAYGVSGFEKPVRDILQKYWQAQALKCKVDGMGNLLGQWSSHLKGKPNILIMAHMDEVGFMVSKIDESGFIRVNPLGGWFSQVLWAKKWVIGIGEGNYITAISGMDSPHAVNHKYRENSVADHALLFLDTGFSRQELLDKGVRPGLPVIPSFDFEVLKPKKRYVGKAFDDRVGLVAMLDVMKIINADPALLNQVNVLFAATVQEEIGLKGAQTVYSSLKPDCVINIEFGVARDYPAQFAHTDEPGLGLGPVIFAYDRSMLPHQGLVEAVYNSAKTHLIPIQWSLENSFGQDASCLQLMGEGIPSINIGVPVRYAHSHTGIMDRDDYDNTVKLLIHTIKALGNVDWL